MPNNKGNNKDKGNGNGNGHNDPKEAPKPEGWQTPYQDEEGTFLSYVSYVQKEEDVDEQGDGNN